MSWKTQIISYGRRFSGASSRFWLALPLMRHLRLILLGLMVIVLVLVLRVPYLLGQINQSLGQNKDLVMIYSTGEYIREFDHLRVGLLEQFAQEQKIIDAQILLDDRVRPYDEESPTIRDHLKQEQNRLRQHLDNYVRLQNFEERDLQAALNHLEDARLVLEKALTELLLWLAVFLILIIMAGKVALADIKTLVPLTRRGNATDVTDPDTTFTSLHEISREALAEAGAENMLDEPNPSSDPLHAPSLMPPPAGLVALAPGGTAQVEILHNHETYKFFTVNFSETGVLLSGLELRPQIFLVGEELIGTLKTDTQAIYFKGQVVRVQQERQSYLYGIKFLSSAFTENKNQ